MITIIDYNTGNIGSIQNILKKIGESSVVTSDIKVVEKATKIILPGVGSFDTGMRNLLELNLINVLNEKVLNEKIPVLGICLGMQLFSDKSEEGKLPGLSWIKGEVVKFRIKNTAEYKIPHMGWNIVVKRKESRLFKDMIPNPRFYFVHSYYLKTYNDSDVLTTTEYESEFTSAIERKNIMGVQFHPEKSHKYGITLLRNFVDF
jgi:glutamine amidotransferase